MSNKSYSVAWMGSNGEFYAEEFSGEDAFFDAETYYTAIEQDGKAACATFTEVTPLAAGGVITRTLSSFSIASVR